MCHLLVHYIEFDMYTISSYGSSGEYFIGPSINRWLENQMHVQNTVVSPLVNLQIYRLNIFRDFDISRFFKITHLIRYPNDPSSLALKTTISQKRLYWKFLMSFWSCLACRTYPGWRQKGYRAPGERSMHCWCEDLITGELEGHFIWRTSWYLNHVKQLLSNEINYECFYSY